MSNLEIGVAVGATLFVLGVGSTIRQVSSSSRITLTFIALISPVLAVVSVLRMIYLVLADKRIAEPCPPGLEEAERAVAVQRQRLFGGPLREPSWAPSIARAYEREVEREMEKVRSFADRVLHQA